MKKYDTAALINKKTRKIKTQGAKNVLTYTGLLKKYRK